MFAAPTRCEFQEKLKQSNGIEIVSQFFKLFNKGFASCFHPLDNPPNGSYDLDDLVQKHTHQYRKQDGRCRRDHKKDIGM